MLHQINATVLTLIPKKENPSAVADYRPIACCNVVYKCIAKLLSDRLASVLPDIISPCQGAFIKGREIVDNILICQDLVRLYNRKSCSSRCMMKIDLKKAFDTIEWDFIEGMIKALGFPARMIQWIMACVRSTSYSIALNGETHGHFKGKRGIRQGDPLSPLLFTICMEYLSRIIQATTGGGRFKYHPLCGGMKLTHLCFADDLLLFCKGEVGSIMTLLRSFSTFSLASGLTMNKEKSHIYFNGMKPVGMKEILQISGFHRGKLPFKYLGVTISSKKLTPKDCTVLTDKIVQKIRGWGVKNLSYTGRTMLVKHVLAQLHSYWARIFILPAGVIRRIENICRNYLWAGDEHYTKAPLVKWDDCCNARKEGGLGLVSSKVWNMALIAKYSWWIASKADHLWVKWVNHIYLKGQHWKEYRPTQNTSWTWRKICSVKEKIQHAYVGDGWLKDGGIYTVGEGFKWLHITPPKVVWHPLVWNRFAVPKHQFITWLIMRGRLLTLDRIQKWAGDIEMGCYLCKEQDESSEHLFFECPFSRACLQELRTQLHCCIPHHSIVPWSIRIRLTSLCKKKTIQAAICGLMYNIWRARNQAARELTVPRPQVVVCQLLMAINQRARLWNEKGNDRQ